MITIEYLGHSSFKIKDSNNTALIIDPFSPASTGLKWSKQEAQILAITHGHDDHSYVDGVTGFEGVPLSAGRVNENAFLVYGPGEYEINNIQIMGIPSFHDSKKGEERGQNTIYLITIEGVTIVHLGDLGHDLPDNLLDELSSANILMLPVGGVYTINHTVAEKILNDISPNIVVPIHYKVDGMTDTFNEVDVVDKFLANVDSENLSKESKLKIKGASSFEQDKTIIWMPE